MRLRSGVVHRPNSDVTTAVSDNSEPSRTQGVANLLLLM